MKILAISDFRVHGLEILKDILNAEKPEVILYAGDDIENLLPFLIPDDPRFILRYNNENYNFNGTDKKISSELKKVILKKKKEFLSERENLINDPNFEKIRFYYVNGNDDFIINIQNQSYFRVFGFPMYIDGNEYFVSKSKNNLLLMNEEKIWARAQKFDDFNVDGECFLDYIDENDILHELKFDGSKAWKKIIDSRDDDGLYIQIDPNYGKFTIDLKNETIKVFGFSCSTGLESNLTDNTPVDFSNIFLSHLPPYGALDLSSRFGVGHIGSKKLSDLVKSLQPDILICGHSHTWGGRIKKIEKTNVINIANHDSQGSNCNYAIIQYENGNYHIQLKKIGMEKSIWELPISSLGTYSHSPLVSPWI